MTKETSQVFKACEVFLVVFVRHPRMFAPSGSSLLYFYRFSTNV